MTTHYDRSLVGNLGGNLNTTQLREEINENGSIGQTCLVVFNEAGIVRIVFEGALDAGEQSAMDSVIAAHTPVPDYFTASPTIGPGETYIASHFRDPDFNRYVIVKTELTDTYGDTKYIFNDSVSSDYTISAPSNGELNPTSFLLTGTGYQEGANIATTGTASASSETQPASNAIDGSISTFWYNKSEPAVGSWWKLDFGSVQGVYGVEVVWYSTTYYATDVSIDYSNDNVNWTLGLREQGITYTGGLLTPGVYKFASFSVPIFARYFRLTCNASNNATYFILKEVRFFKAEASGFPTGTDVAISNIKANRQIDTEIWDIVNFCSLDGYFPTGTTTKVLLSFDSQVTWVYWNGSAWTVSSLANIATAAMSQTTFNALTNANFQASNGLNSATKTLDVAVNISTTDGGKSPVVSGITFNVTTSILKELGCDASRRIRFLTENKTEIKNITETTATYDITIFQS